MQPLFAVEDLVQEAARAATNEGPEPTFAYCWSHSWNKLGFMKGGNFILNPQTGIALFEDGSVSRLVSDFDFK